MLRCPAGGVNGSLVDVAFCERRVGFERDACPEHSYCQPGLKQANISGFGADHAFLWTSGAGMLDLGTLGGSRSVASGINDAGIVVGTSNVADGHPHAFLWSRLTGMEDLGTLGGGSSQASGINNRGAVTGSSTLPDGTTHAFVWTPNRGMVDLGVLAGGVESAGAGINSRGEVVGVSDDASSISSLAVYWPAPLGAELE
jgi:probable HAF family extracellular repeat protein